MNRITDKIYLCDWVEANNEHFLRGNDITAVFNVCNERDTLILNGISFNHYPMNDDATTNEDQILHAVKALELILKDNNKVAVHCLAGVSRSPLIVALYIGWKTGTNFKEALNFVRAARPLVKPNIHFIGLGQTILDRLKAGG